MANTSAIWQQAKHTTYYHLLAVQQVPYKKYPKKILMKNVLNEEFSGENKSAEQTISRKNDTRLQE